MERKLRDKYGSSIKIEKDLISIDPIDFDHNYLFPNKSKNNFPLGGIFFGPQSKNLTYNTYEFTSVINTRVPTSCMFLQTLAAETYINMIKNSNISIILSQNPFPRTIR